MFTSRLFFFISLFLLLCTPFLSVDVLYFSDITTRVMLFAIAVIGIIVPTLLTARHNADFRLKLITAATSPVILIYGLMIDWLFIRSLPNASPELWWGSFDRTDGLVFHIAWLMLCVACAAWSQHGDGFFTMTKLSSYWVYFVIAITTVFGIAEVIVWYSIQQTRLSGSVGNPLYLAGLLLFIPWAAQFITNTYLRWGSIVFAAVALYATDTRGAFLAAIAMIFVYLVGTHRISARLRAVIAVICIVAAAGFFVAVTQDRISSARMATIQTRIAQWQSGWSEFKKTPLIGFGSGSHIDAIDRGSVALKTAAYSEISNTTHSAYLDLALRGGMIAVLIFFVWVAVVLFALWKKTPQLTPDQRLIAVATFIGYLVFIATSFISVWHLIPFILIFALVKTDKIVKVSDRTIVNTANAVGAVVIVSMIILLTTMLYAGLYLKKTNDALARRQWQEIPRASLRLVRWAPFAADFYVEQLKISLPNTQRAVVPSYETYVQQRVVPTVHTMLAWNNLHPQQYHVVASWITAYINSGLTSEHAQWFHLAASAQERALKISPDRPQSVFQIADVYRELGRVDDSLEMLKSFAERYPKLPEAHLFYGLMLDIAGKKFEASQQAHEALQLRELRNWQANHREWLEAISSSIPL